MKKTEHTGWLPVCSTFVYSVNCGISETGILTFQDGFASL